MIKIAIVSTLLATCLSTWAQKSADPSPYNVVWNSPGDDSLEKLLLYLKAPEWPVSWILARKIVSIRPARRLDPKDWLCSLWNRLTA